MIPWIAQAYDTSRMTLLGWGVVAGATCFVAWTFWRAIRLTVSPGEEAPDHVKRGILRDGAEEPEVGSPAWRAMTAADAAPGRGAG
ncbi:MAG: hypothetical protein ACC662_06440 [Planctomycetota bacterium]